MPHDPEFGALFDTLLLDKPVAQPSPPRDPRLLTIFRVGKLTTDRFEELCLIRNVGVGGVMAHVNSPLVARQRVRVELRSDRKLWGQVLWIKGKTAGIGFDGQVDLEEVLARSEAENQGRRLNGPRLNLDCSAELRVGAIYHRVRLHDLGQTGAGVAFTGQLEDAQEVVLTPEGFRPIHGVALWCHNGRAGIAFNRPIPFAELTSWLEKMFGRPCVETRRSPH